MLCFRMNFAIDAPVLVSPFNSSLTWAGVMLDWNAVAGASYYQLQIDSVTSFNSPFLFDTLEASLGTANTWGDTEHFVDDLFFGETYYWRVRTLSATDTSAWSSNMAFITRNYVNLSLPFSGTYNFTGILLDWNAHEGVDNYDFELDTSPNFNSVALVQGSTAYLSYLNNFSDSEEFIENLYFGKTYYWRVRARNLVDTSGWSIAWNFNTYDYVTLYEPVNGSLVYAGITLDWFAFDGIELYQFAVDTTPNFNSGAYQTGIDTFQFFLNNNSDTEEFVDDLFFGKQHFWRVRAINAVDTSSWSATRNFTTKDEMFLSSPANNSFSFTGTTIDWDAYSGVDFYDFQIDTSSQFNTSAIFIGTTSYINQFSSNQDTEYYLFNLFFGKKYFWRVRARNAVDTTVWSDIWSFTIHDTLFMNAPISFSSTFTSTTIDWDAHTGVNYYDYQIDTSINFNSPIFYEGINDYINSSSLNIDTEKYLENLYFGEYYYWRIRARNDEDTTKWTTPWNFYTLQQVGLYSPQNEALNQDLAGITLDWWAHEGANFYYLEVDTSNAFNTPFLIQETIPYLYASNDSSDTEYFTGPLAANRFYFWRVRMSNTIDTAIWETRWFSTGNQMLELPIPPVLVSPLLSEIEVDIDPQLDWTDINGATGYHFQISTNPDLTNATEQFSPVSFADILNLNFNTTYYWRVRTYDGNFVSDWTYTSHFTTSEVGLAAPFLTSPPNLSINLPTNNVMLQWHPVADSEDYYIQYTTDSNFVSMVYTQNTSDTFLLIGGLDFETDYFWHVKAVSSVITNSSWCDSWKFTTMNDVSVNENLYNDYLTVYPNPTSNFLNIQSNNFSTLEGIQVFDVFGTKIFEEYNIDKYLHTINLNNLKSGIYFLNIIVGDKIYTRKIVLTK